ncbi:polysaccharide biosynthesis protein [Phaeobacter inhibens]|uniref:polysaccharide biosynthesis/export family protein n=1 Tax=Phaeobacter inhibens TaxID=221822 RepID=UPI0021A7548B|nr:polysaccharide biosynthesis/export family protein [Phaeobacter inhibens]UWR55143.1 polysaccharide biosynthesis/export family protein [Phaeobacter inhibens]UWR70779.1 polysaccharide biosynthesis/export family protein [Phaeobacter inhibens]GLO72910.1 polysaccharide biosynthesis protein [Phaeobacter inhibens]
MRRLSLLLAALGLALLPAACGRLPGGAPASEEILKTADDADADFALYPVTRAFLPTVAHWPETGPESGGAHPGKRPLKWIGATQGAKTQIIQPGDLLTLRIWDSSDNSLLTTPDEKMVQLQDVTVAANGSIFMPYVGNVNVNGLTPDLARERLQTAMEEIVPSAQLQLDMTEGRGNSVDLVSGVETPGTYPMPDRNYTVMGLIAAGGGISASLNNPQIRLVRGRSIYGTSVETLLNDPRRDTLLRGGDRVFVEEDARYFLSFGATGREDLHTFTKDQMSAMDAMSVAGGFQDSRADPQGLLVLREYPDSALAPGQRGPRQPRVVFTLDLTSADGLFSARRFKINSGDLLIATEAPVNDALTISNIIGNFFGVFSRAGAL